MNTHAVLGYPTCQTCIPNEQIGSLVRPETKGSGSGLVRQIWYFTDTEGAIGGIGIGEAADEQEYSVSSNNYRFRVMFWLWK